MQSKLENIRPILKTTLSNNLIVVTTPSVFAYTITDYNGRSISKGSLTQGNNNIQINYLSKGMYIIQFNNGQVQYAEKFMKQ